VLLFPAKGIAQIYWPIDYTPNIGFVWLFRTKRIAHIYWPIDYAPKLRFV
jgi:hypothetical protein